MKTPDEIKKGLECVADEDGGCSTCPYRYEEECKVEAAKDALALIQQLQAENAQQARCIENMTDKLNAMNGEVAKLQAERDAAVAFLPRKCYLCKHVGNKMGDAPCPSLCKYITLDECPNWQWRGVQKEE